MELSVDVAQPIACDVGIDFGGADVRVTEQFLDDAQVRAVFQQMRGEAVAQHVGRDIASDARASDASFDVCPHRDGSERAATTGQKNIRGRARLYQFWTPGGEI